MNGWTDGRKDGRTAGQKDGPMDGRRLLYRDARKHLKTNSENGIFPSPDLLVGDIRIGSKIPLLN